MNGALGDGARGGGEAAFYPTRKVVAVPQLLVGTARRRAPVLCGNNLKLLKSS